MQRKSIPLLIKNADDDSDTLTGLASVFDNLDHDGDIVRRGAFSKSLGSGSPITLLPMRKADGPRKYVGRCHRGQLLGHVTCEWPWRAAAATGALRALRRMSHPSVCSKQRHEHAELDW